MDPGQPSTTRLAKVEVAFRTGSPSMSSQVVSILQFRHWSGGRGERAKERWLKRADCLQRKEVSPAQTTDSEGTRKRFFYRGRPWEGRNGYGRCLAQRSSADKSGMHLCLDAANQVHATEREHDRVGEPDRDAAFAFWSIFSGEPFR